MSICELCKEEKKLCDSHIYPEFLYKSLYDKNHGYYTISTSTDKYPGYPKKGIYDELLCKDCESHISKFETYGKEILFGGVVLAFKEDGPIIEVTGIDYDKYKLFQLSLLWRASIHSRHEMHALELGPHKEELRKMLLNEDPGDYFEYGVFQMTINFKKEMLSEFIYPLEPIKNRIDGIRMYRGIFCGIFWAFLVSSHNNKFRLKESFLNKNGEMKILRDTSVGKEFMEELFYDLGANDKNLSIKTT